MKKIHILCILVLIFMFPVLCHPSEQDNYARKDPILAGALSWYVPGLGQLYAGALLKGAVFFVIEEALLISTVLTFAKLKLDVTGDIDIGLNIKSKSETNKSERRTGIILGVSFITVHFFNVIDAVNTTRKYNRSHQMRVYTDFHYGINRDVYEFGFKKPF